MFKGRRRVSLIFRLYLLHFLYISLFLPKNDIISSRQVHIEVNYQFFVHNSIFLRKNLDGKEVRYDERVFGRDENDQGSGVASEGFF